MFTDKTTGISSKLDFDDFNSSPKIVASSYEKPFSTLHKSIKNEKVKVAYKLEDIGVYQGEKKDNKTQGNKSGDTIKTDVLVQINTKVDIATNNKTHFVDNSSDDVPIIIGKPDSNFDGRTRPTTFIADSSVPSINPSIGPTDNLFPSQSLHLQNVQPTYNFPLTRSQNDINGKSRDEIIITNAKNKENRIQLRTPHFGQVYNRYYFGENPPPQLIWYPQSYEISNTGRKLDPMFRPSTVQRPSITCTYKNGPTTGLTWYPKKPIYSEDPGRQINDKLAPLN